MSGRRTRHGMGQAAGPDKLSDAACRGRTDASSHIYGMIISRLFDFVNSGFSV